MLKYYRILSIEACDLFVHDNPKDGIGYKLPQEGTDAFYEAFINKLDYSLDSIEMAKVYQESFGTPFSFTDKYNNEYTRAVVNVKFNYCIYKKVHGKKTNRIEVNLKQLREHCYEKGFYLEGVRYVRYKRSAGSSRQGKCLFIDERLYNKMCAWSECGLSPTQDLASWEAYKSLSLSSLKGTVNVPIDGILFVPDFKVTFPEQVVSVELQNGELIAETKTADVTNDIWDGESLLDESIFEANYSEKHMLLLRNKFFKSCAFRTKLQKWIKDKNITLQDLKHRGFVTLATDISQIVMVTTPNSLKYLKFAGGLCQDNVQQWANHVDSVFGVVKWDKRTSFFDGRMVRSSYQLLNTLGLNQEHVEAMLQPSKDYLTTIRNDIDFMRYHFSDVRAKEEYGEQRDLPDGLAQRAEIIFELMNINSDFQRTELYKEFRNDMVKAQKDRLLEGHLLFGGTNATLFGNGPELLKYIAGEEIESTLQPGKICCGKFPHGRKLLCARSPHITMGNLYCVENDIEGDIWNYFDLGENIVCVNAIGENIQQRLNGCDYDSDTMLVTDDSMLIETAAKFSNFFKVPVCNIASSSAAKFTLAELDHNTSVNKIGEIVNLSQKLNSIIWDRLNNGNDDVWDLYLDVCKLAVLSGLEIDKAKRTYDNVSVSSELNLIRNKYCYLSPRFFKMIDGKFNNDGAKSKKYACYDTAMEYVYASASTIDFRSGKDKFASYLPISAMLNVKVTTSSADCDAIDNVIELDNFYNEVINRLYMKKRKADTDEQEVIFDQIRDKKAERDETINQLITNGNILYWVLAHYEQNYKSIKWNIYAPILGCKAFRRILKESKQKLSVIKEDPSGEYALYKFRYTKK